MAIPTGNIVKTLRDLIDDQLRRIKHTQVFVVTGINESDYTCNIKHPTRALQFDRVPLISPTLGHNKGIMCLPSVGDWVLITWLGGVQERPFILGCIFDDFTQGQDNIPQIKEGQMLLCPQEAGSFISINPDHSVVIKTVDDNNNPANGAKIKLYPDGSFKMFNKENFGIEIDKDGNMTLRGTTINATQNPGTL